MIANLVDLALGRAGDAVISPIVRAVRAAANAVEPANHDPPWFARIFLGGGAESPGRAPEACESFIAALLGQGITVQRGYTAAPGLVALAIAHLDRPTVLFAAHGRAQVARLIVAAAGR